MAAWLCTDMRRDLCKATFMYRHVLAVDKSCMWLLYAAAEQLHVCIMALCASLQVQDCWAMTSVLSITGQQHTAQATAAVVLTAVLLHAHM